MENSGKIKVRLDLYKSEEKQTKFLLHIALTFRLLPETLADLFQMPVEEINKMLFYGGVSCIGLDYLINNEYPDQEISVKNFLQFYSDLISAIKVKDKSKMEELLNYLYDAKALKIARTREHGDSMSIEDIEAIALYQLKYGLSQRAICNIFNLSKKSYYYRMEKFLENNPEVQRRFDHFNNYMEINGGRK